MDKTFVKASGNALGGTFDDTSPSKNRRVSRHQLIYLLQDLLVVWDILSIGLTGFFCAIVYQKTSVESQTSADFITTAVRMAIVGAMLAPFLMTEHRRRHSAGLMQVGEIVRRTARGLSMLVGLLLVVGFLTHVVASIPRLWVLYWVAAAFTMTLSGRLVLNHVFLRLRRVGLLSDRIAIFGGGIAAHQLLHYLDLQRDSGVRVVAVFGDVLSTEDASFDQSMGQLIALGQRNELDRVILTLPFTAENRVFEIVYRLKMLDVEVAHCAPHFGAMGVLSQITQVAGAPLTVLTNRPFQPWGLFVREIEDRVLAGLAIILFGPLMMLIALAIRLDSPGPAIFRQLRHGWNGTEFLVFKFRTMHKGVSNGTGEVQTKRHDHRITRFGQFLRRTSLDELPQLLNVLNGTMSLVGPRPHPVMMRTEQRLGEEIIAEYSHRHRVKPGLTGWAQINGYRGATETAEQIRKRIEFDIYYIEHWSLLFDLRIILTTPYKILFERNNAF